jgi:alpha-D-ribose 1-methylphosphonate 5-triphosphate diphosphatase
MTTFGIRNAIAVLPDRLVHEATIVIQDGLITSVTERGPAPPGAIDAQGAICIPGVVDTHSDGLEKELRPRPGVELPIDFALHSFEGRVRAAGVTTMFHGVGFEENERQERSISLATQLCDAITKRTASPDALVDHRILYRLDARDDRGFEALAHRLVSEGLMESTDLAQLPLVSFEDHTPGQGQYQDRSAFERYIRGTRGLSEGEARAAVDQLILERDSLLHNREQALAWLTDRAARKRIQLMAHDPANAADVNQATSWNAQIAEFPTTVEAARAARAAGLRTVCGAPNVLRGGSHSGNVSASELIALDLCDGLASDYLPSALIGAAAVLISDGVCDPVTAFGLITHGPADTVGLTDRGRLVEGAIGDLVLLRLEGRLATVRMVHRSELVAEQHHQTVEAVAV